MGSAHPARIENKTSSNCAPQGLQMLRCAALDSIENTCAPAFKKHLLTEGLKTPAGKKTQIWPHVKGRILLKKRNE
jgi:hypothetical protein